MHDKIIRALVEAGLPEPCCPTCHTDNWEWRGHSDDGVIAVVCRTCDRLYVSMDAATRYHYYAEQSGMHLMHGRAAEAGRDFHLMMSVWTNYDRLKDEPAVLVCISDGYSEEFDDDSSPF